MATMPAQTGTVARLAVGPAGDHRAHPPAHRATADHDPVVVDGVELAANSGEQLRWAVGARRPSRR